METQVNRLRSFLGIFTSGGFAYTRREYFVYTSGGSCRVACIIPPKN